MNLKTIFLTFLFITFSGNILSAQKNEKQVITAVDFQKDKIILNKKTAFNYIKNGNSFSILNLDNQEIISGEIISLGEGEFSSVIIFTESGKNFSNDKIIGRNDLIFALCENNVFTKDFKIDKAKLDEFLKKYNQLN